MRTAFLCIAAVCLLAGCAAPKPVYAPAPAYVYLDGEFKEPGVYAWTNGMTMRDAVVSAGGFTPFALHWIRVDHSDGTSESLKLLGGAIANNPVLRPGDRITIYRR